MTFKEKIIMEITLNKLLDDDWKIVAIKDVRICDDEGNVIMSFGDWFDEDTYKDEEEN